MQPNTECLSTGHTVSSLFTTWRRQQLTSKRHVTPESLNLGEMNVQVDHVHLICMIPPKLRVSDYVGIVKGRTAIRLLKRFPDLRKRRYWGNHFWTKGYCVDTVGLDEDKIRQYVKYQEDRERREEQMKFGF